MDCPGCGSQGLQLGGRCTRCGVQAPLVAGPPGFLPPPKLELSGLQMAIVMLATFAATVATIFLAFTTDLLALLFTSGLGLWALLVMVAYFVIPGTLIGYLLYRRFLAQNLARIAKGQAPGGRPSNP